MRTMTLLIAKGVSVLGAEMYLLVISVIIKTDIYENQNILRISYYVNTHYLGILLISKSLNLFVCSNPF